MIPAVLMNLGFAASDTAAPVQTGLPTVTHVSRHVWPPPALLLVGLLARWLA